MGKFKFVDTGFPGSYVIEPSVFGDERGFFMECYSELDFKEAGLDLTFVQDNHSRSRKGVLRGMHFQKEHPQGKLIRVPRGAVFNALIDLRKGSPTYGKWFGVELSAENKKMLYIPRGCAQGFLILEDNTDYMYKCTDFYHPDDEGGLKWDDTDIDIQWPLDKVGGNQVLSDKDKNWPAFKDLNFTFEFEKYKI
jgi:dTDP-4-dehydrorhamnose 3,5-epimerase